MILNSMRKLAAATGFAILMLGVGCGGDSSEPGVQVVATTSILGDVMRNIAGDDASVEVLIPVGVDPHDYRASSQQAAALVRADVVVVNGLGLEEGLEDVIAAAAQDGARILDIGTLVDPLTFEDGVTSDPHIWLDPVRMAEVVRELGATMAALYPEGDWQAAAAAYAEEMIETHDDVVATLDSIPAENRKLITNHDSLRYFAARYGFEVIGTVIPGGGTAAAPSSADLAELVELINQTGVAAIFAETTESPALAEALAAEVGGRIEVVELFVGSVGPDAATDTLIDLWLENASRIAAALA